MGHDGSCCQEDPFKAPGSVRSDMVHTHTYSANGGALQDRYIKIRPTMLDKAPVHDGAVHTPKNFPVISTEECVHHTHRVD